MKKEILKSQNGQAILVILLIMSVGLTISLAVLSRTTTDISISRREEESARAFSAAEAGIEELLRPGAGTTFASPDIGSGAAVEASVTLKTGLVDFLFPEEILPGELATLWLADHDSGGNLIESRYYQANSFDLCWDGGAVEVSVYYKDGGDYQVARGAYDPNGSRRGTNNFSAPDGGGCLGLANKKTVRFSNLGIPGGATLLVANLKPYYAVTTLGAVAAGGAGGLFPSQGKEIVSTGSFEMITRKVRVFRSWPAPPAIFDYGLFSGGNLSK